ncbi:hypothetical protein [Haloprofundus halobius]|uniref:hypothetical protein n=1 Tax=Haloprofundus halobius TaxID=2876194 RepID=UPI001CCBA718|nr:hypothetical protein [Haloprofundus halobius]
MLGIVLEDGEAFYCKSGECITGEYTWKFMLVLSEEFDEDLFVLNDAPYFRTSKVTESENRDDIDFVQLPPYSLDMKPVEGC